MNAFLRFLKSFAPAAAANEEYATAMSSLAATVREMNDNAREYLALPSPSEPAETNGHKPAKRLAAK